MTLNLINDENFHRQVIIDCYALLQIDTENYQFDRETNTAIEKLRYYTHTLQHIQRIAAPYQNIIDQDTSGILAPGAYHCCARVSK